MGVDTLLHSLYLGSNLGLGAMLVWHYGYTLRYVNSEQLDVVCNKAQCCAGLKAHGNGNSCE